MLKFCNKLLKNRGQISLPWLLGIAASVALASFGSYSMTTRITDAKIDTLKIVDSEIQQRVATLEEAVKTIKTDTGEIKKDIKSILQIVK